ncbi:M48 family metallopeptidase [uncultured Campylobacter sp.]|uniref:M48 family metallopeptidase n=1 Tax=uncultured Campylobacter sp. TaxID=218934 RepID=UPI002606CC78|nr:M48 family metallopeptidase [uncultured Campylobacter sp.]
MAEQKVSLNLLGLPISLRFKRMKYARIRISKDCEISVSVPRSYTAAQAKDFILKHESWIRRTLERLRSKLLASDEVRILGKIYKLKFSREAELSTNCGANKNLDNGGTRGWVNWANDDTNSHAGSVNSAHLQSGAGISGSSTGGYVGGSANNGTGGMNYGAGGGTASEILKFHSGECASQNGAASENLKFDLPGDAAQGLAQQSGVRQSGGFIDTAAQNVFEQSCGEIFKFHSDGCDLQNGDLEFNLAREDASLKGGENFKFNPTAKGKILKFDPAVRDGISNFKPVASGEISNFSSVVSEEISVSGEKISKSASENVPQNVAQSTQAAEIECDEPDFTIKNFIQSSKFKDKIFISRDVIFCESEGEFTAFKKAFALELYLRYIEKFSPRIGRKIARVRVRKMHTRWGSCNHAKGYLNFSLSLIERDPRFVEYVVLHELAHLIHANHGADFYALIAQIMPDFRARIKLGKG